MEIYRFESYSLDAERRELRRQTELVKLEPQVFDVLLYLVRHRDRVISKDELLGSVWRGRIVSESTLSSRINAVRHAVEDSGERQRLVRTARRNGYRFVGGVLRLPAERNEVTHTGLPSPEASHIVPLPWSTAVRLRLRPAIAIVPFANLSAEPAVEHFIDGVVEDATTALSRFPWLFVVARSSSFAYRGKCLDVRQVGRELGVSYVLEGSVRRASECVRITARLVDAATGLQLWANRFDLPFADRFDVQDRATSLVVGAVGPKLEEIEVQRIKGKPTTGTDAYELYLRGMSEAYRWTQKSMDEALRLFHQAVDNDSEFAPAYGMAAYCYVQRQSYGWFTDRSQETVACERLGRRAAELAKADAVTLTRAAHALASVVHDMDSGAALIEQALRLNPSLALGWYVSGWLRIFSGQPDVGIEHLTNAVRLNPFDPLAFKMQAGVAYANFFLERYDAACVAAAHAMRARPNYLTAVRGAAASHALAGRLGEAQRLMARMRANDSALRISKLDGLLPFRRSADFDHWAEALRLAGLPV